MPSGSRSAHDSAVVGSAGERDKSQLEQLRPFLNTFHNRRSELVAALDVALTAQLAELLFQILRGEQEQLGAHCVGPVDEALELRSRLCRRIVYSDESGAEEAIAKLAMYDPQLRDARARVLAHRRVGDVFGDFERRWVPTARAVVRVFETQSYRYLRTSGDLSMVLVELLGTVRESISEDLDLLYSSSATSAAKKPRRPKEFALQAYVRRRLADMLPRYCDDPNVELLREPQIKRRGRYDLLVVARLATRGMGTVVIELKWAHDSRVRPAMTAQLGDRYLRDENRTHGIYVVGLTLADAASHRLEADLDKRRKAYLASFPGLSIETVMLPCQWAVPAKTTKSRSTRTTKKAAVRNEGKELKGRRKRSKDGASAGSRGKRSKAGQDDPSPRIAR